MTVGAIWAQNAQGIIGRDGKIPWKYSGDFRRFKRVTMGATIIMGRLTWESIGTRPLPGRRNIVVSSALCAADATSRHECLVSSGDTSVHLAEDVPFAMRLAEIPRSQSPDVWFIGGRRIYEAAMGYVDTIDVTLVPDEVPADGAVYAPPILQDLFDAGDWVQHEDEPTLKRRVYTRRPSSGAW
jgi:dihydrofolate reductase